MRLFFLLVFCGVLVLVAKSAQTANDVRSKYFRMIIAHRRDWVAGGKMKLARLRLSNFRSFGASPTEIDLDDLTFLLGPNGAGKTAALQALARMFGFDPAQRRVKKSDFHVPHDEAPEQAPAQRELWIEADFEFVVAGGFLTQVLL